MAGLYRAFEESRQESTRDLTTEDVLVAVGETRPLSAAMAGRIQTMTRWAHENARMASAES